MPDEREQLIERILDTNRRFYHRYLQLGGDREWTEVDLTMPQLKALFVVAVSKGVTMTQLARTVGMTLSTATGVADRLIEQGLIRREHHPDDRRLVLLHATEAGVALLDRLTQIGRAHFELVARRLSLEELSLLARAQDRLFQAMLEVSSEELAAGSSVG